MINPYRSPSQSRQTVPGQFPVTIYLTLVVLVIAAITSRISVDRYADVLHWLGFSWGVLADGRIWQVFTGTLLQSKPGIELNEFLTVVSALALGEYFAGSRRTLIVFFVSDWIATFLTAIAIRVLAHFEVADSVMHVIPPDSGSSAACHGVFALAASLLPGKWAGAGFSILLIAAIVQLWTVSLGAAVAHLLAVGVGAAFGWKIRHQPR